MQDFSWERVSHDVCVWPPLVPLSDSDVEKMISDPQAMYYHALRTHKRLPERLHEAMLLFSFHPEFREEVRQYLNWVVVCEERDARMESYKKSELFRDRIIFGSLFLVVVAYVILVIDMVF